MARRVELFKRDYPEFKSLPGNMVAHFIKLYDSNFDEMFQYPSMALIVSGGYLLWVCWLFFNGVAGKSLTQHASNNIIQQTIMKERSVSSLLVFYFHPLLLRANRKKLHDQNPVNLVNGLLAGLISITGSANNLINSNMTQFTYLLNVANHGAFVIGIIGGFVFMIASIIWNKLRIDDPLHASQIHGMCGLWGVLIIRHIYFIVLAIGFFDKDKGLVYTQDWHQLGIQAIGSVALILWSGLISFPFFYALKKINKLRVAPIYEIIGLDTLMHEEIEKLKIMK